MSPTSLPNCMEFNDRLENKDLMMPNAALYEQHYLSAAVSQVLGLEKQDLRALASLTAANAVRRPPVSRRHSSTTYSITTTKSPHMMPYTDVYPPMPGTLETLTEEGFRSRAFSEGSAMLNSESVHEQQQPQSPPSRYKTELCRPFEESGKCKYGDKCQFAHGKNELRQMVRHPKYKTELCRTYHTSGLCPYGPRCHFIHNQDDSVAMGAKRPTGGAPAVQRPQRPNGGSRPSNLQLVTQRSSNRLSSYPYSPSFANSPGLEQGLAFIGAKETPMLSPISPMSKANDHFFSYGKASSMPGMEISRGLASAPIPEHKQTHFDFPIMPRSELAYHDDLVFDGPPTPPDSDRESATGSPPGFGGQTTSCPQRLPIFRCLSQQSE